MLFSEKEILEVIRMVEMECLDIRTVTLSLSVRDCADQKVDLVAERVYHKIVEYAKNLVSTAQKVENEFGIPIVNKRISVTPIGFIADSCKEDDLLPIAKAMEKAAEEVGVDYIGGFSAFIQKGFTKGDLKLVRSIPRALSQTNRICSSVNVASTKSGINMDAIYLMSGIIKETALLTSSDGGVGCAKLVVFCNIPEDNPFIAGACTGMGEPECSINVGVSGPGVIRSALEKVDKKMDLGSLADLFKRLSFKITRAGELMGKEVARQLEIPFGIVDLSLAPTPAKGDSVANILEAIGLKYCGAPGSTAALALLTDAVKKGGAMAGSYVGGLSGAFIPVSEDSGMIQAAKNGFLSLEKLEAMTAVCSVGLDMVAVPGDTPVETISALIADEMAIGMINRKTTAVRVIPVPGKKVGDMVDYGGLLGTAYVMAIHSSASDIFIQRKGRIPAPIQSLTN